MKPEPVNMSVIEVMNMNREQRRRIAKLNGIKHIPSIVNVQVINAPASSIKKVGEQFEVPHNELIA